MPETEFALDPQLDELIARMPKVELHLHLEGTLEPELAFELAGRNGVALPYSSVAEMREAYEFKDLQSFLDLYYATSAVLCTREDFHDLTMAYLRRANADEVRHVEPFFDPQVHTERGVPFDVVISGILSGLADGQREFGITSRLIMSFVRHLPAESAATTLAVAEPWIGQLAAVGLDSTEIGNPPERFADVFARARSLGLHTVAHAGEEGDASLVVRTLNALGCSRIDHGVRAAEDPGAMQRLAEDDVTLTVCPLSNLRLRVFPAMEKLPIRKLLNAGVAVTINSDDPAYFGGYIAENFRVATAALGLKADDLYQLSVFAIAGSFADTRRKLDLMAELETCFDRAEDHA